MIKRLTGADPVDPPFGVLQGNSEQEPRLDKVPGGLIYGHTCLGPPASPKLGRCWVTAPHILPGLPALNRRAGVCSVLPRYPGSPASADLKPPPSTRTPHLNGDLPDPGTEPKSSVLAGRFFTTEPPGKPVLQTGVCNVRDLGLISGSGRSPG